MPSAWGKSWGSAFGAAWGMAVQPAEHLASSIFTTTGGPVLGASLNSNLQPSNPSRHTTVQLREASAWLFNRR